MASKRVYTHDLVASRPAGRHRGLPHHGRDLPVDVGERIASCSSRPRTTSLRSARSPRVTDSVRSPAALAQCSFGVARGVTMPPADQLTAPRRGTREPDDVPVDGQTRQLEREYRAVVEEILDLRGATTASGRSCARSTSQARWPTPSATRPTSAPGEGPAPRDARRHRAAGALRRHAARAAYRAAGAAEDPRRRPRGAEKQQREYFLRKQMESIQQGAGRGRRVRRRGVPYEDRRSLGMPESVASRPPRRSGASSAWASTRARRR